MTIVQYGKMLKLLEEYQTEFHEHIHMIMCIQAANKFLEEIWNFYSLERIDEGRFFEIWDAKGTINRIRDTAHYKVYIQPLPRFVVEVYLRELASYDCKHLIEQLWDYTTVFKE